MIEWALDTYYADAFNSAAIVERSLIVYDTAESALAPIMEAVEKRYPGVRTFSLPSIGDGRDGKPARRHVELGVKGAGAASVDAAFEAMRNEVERLPAEYEPAQRA
jgi:molybdopterin-biosynthesis enzyme MoeA-like protein